MQNRTKLIIVIVGIVIVLGGVALVILSLRSGNNSDGSGATTTATSQQTDTTGITVVKDYTLSYDSDDKQIIIGGNVNNSTSKSHDLLISVVITNTSGVVQARLSESVSNAKANAKTPFNFVEDYNGEKTGITATFEVIAKYDPSN